MPDLTIRPISPADLAEWQRMRQALWPDLSPQEMQTETTEISADPEQAVFVIDRPSGGLGGFIEASLRPWADGCKTRPVGYIEGWYVDEDLRRAGWGGKLVQTAEAWAAEQGCREMASDCETWNTVSYQAHQALGYEEVIRVIEFRKTIRPARE